MIVLDPIKDLVLDSTKSVGGGVTVSDADVEETVGTDGESALLIRLLVTHDQQASWTETRLRIAQKIRDELLRTGDDRYPFVMMLTPSEWSKRDR